MIRSFELAEDFLSTPATKVGFKMEIDRQVQVRSE